MKSSRVLVAVVAVLCLAAMASAAVVDVQPGANWAKISGYVTYTQGLNLNDDLMDSPKDMFFAKYDISAITSDPSIVITSAKMVYWRGYSGTDTNNQGTMTIAQQTLDYTLDTGTDHGTAFHQALAGNGVLHGINFCSAAQVVNNPADDNGPYAGVQSVDVTSILQSWAGGADNYGVGMSVNVYEPFNYVYPSHFLPYLEVTTAPAPEPATMGLLLAGGIATVLRRRRSA
jgi:hypothetical protein